MYSTNVRMTKMNNRKRELIEHLVRSMRIIDDYKRSFKEYDKALDEFLEEK